MIDTLYLRYLPALVLYATDALKPKRITEITQTLSLPKHITEITEILSIHSLTHDTRRI